MGERRGVGEGKGEIDRTDSQINKNRRIKKITYFTSEGEIISRFIHPLREGEGENRDRKDRKKKQQTDE